MLPEKKENIEKLRQEVLKLHSSDHPGMTLLSDIVEACMYTSSAGALWMKLESRFGESNGSSIYQLQREIASISQGYFRNDSIKSIDAVLNRIERDVRSHKSQILAMDPLSDVNKAFSMVLRVERQMEVNLAFPDSGEAIAMEKTKGGKTYAVNVSKEMKDDVGNISELVKAEILKLMRKNVELEPVHVNYARLDEFAEEDIYMHVPEGYVAPLGKHSSHDHCIFTKAQGADVLALLVYVDDILLCGSSSFLIDGVKNYLDAMFTIKDLGYSKYFIGLEITRAPTGTTVTQTKLVFGLLEDIKKTMVSQSSAKAEYRSLATTVYELQ
ncbi:UNVERIFIED_CONTAM: putative mitochondrial protein [Sesamum calycinum]|uniref:Mitochondrial protein n=1 Tax=Sesamum calycinum TaxID=2727403 RepID=A0AAW2NUW0_9LAMI